ncbi:MAG TPA: hypothetical protein VK921_08105 [Anditalea sp.]|nr:hypothetical protein [Anditalea sp.]
MGLVDEFLPVPPPPALNLLGKLEMFRSAITVEILPIHYRQEYGLATQSIF